MELTRVDGQLGVAVEDFRLADATDEDFELLKKTIYTEKAVVLKEQALSPSEYVALGERFGTLVPYHEPMYHHREHDVIFVSSNVPTDGELIGVPKTGQFWHSDYQFMAQPFAFTIFYPQQLPREKRGTYFVNMAEAYESLTPELQAACVGRLASHTVRRYFKIRPSDVYRPLGDLIDEVERHTPPATFPLVFVHPVTGEHILFISEGFTAEIPGDGGTELLRKLLEASGQLDETFQHPLVRWHRYEPGDIVIWDNRTMVHRALHSTNDDPAVSWRLTALDGLPLHAGAL